MTDERKRVVVIGGGSGIQPTLQGLKAFYSEIAVTAVVTMADSGGSNARIRDEFGLLPLSDVKNSLAALASGPEERDQLVRELFAYRYQNGEGIKGHHFGNLLMIALTDLLGSEARAIDAAAKILRVRGVVLPVTSDDMHLCAEYEDGMVVRGQHEIDKPPAHRYGIRIRNLWLQPEGTIRPVVADALSTADLIVLGPGDLYTSLLANCVVSGMSAAIRRAPGSFVYVSNLMTRPGQTDGLTVLGHVQEVSRYVGRSPDSVVVNTSTIASDLLEKYAALGQFPVVDDSDQLQCTVIKSDLLSPELVERDPADVLERSLVRGDAKKTAKLIRDLVLQT